MSNVLRPMSTGEVLDRTFNVYRHNFKLFVAIGTVPALMWFVTNSLVVLMQNLQPRSMNARFSGMAIAISGLTLIVGFVIYMCGVAIAHGAVSYAVSAIHLDRPTGFSESYRRIKGKYLRILNVVISVFIRIFGTAVLIVVAVAAITLMPGMNSSDPMYTAIMIIAILVGMVVAAWLMLRMSARYALSVPACVLEDLPARKAIKRSVALSKGSVGRILTVYILFSLINAAFAFGAQLPFQIATIAAKSQTARVILALGNNFSSSLIAAVVGPLVTIALTLMYYDERVRKEAFDLNYMMEMLEAPTPAEPGSGTAAADATSA
jgi:Membrane domain of glycerophosphoryl diester phosphodiesterase